MGRGRIPMKMIQKEKARKTTFQKRKSGLMKKVYEFSTLCGVDVCVIMYAPNFEGEGFAEAETWPQDKDEVHRILEKYYNTTGDRRLKIYNVEEYYKERIKKVEGEISKVHKEILKHKYPTWDKSLNDVGVDELKIFYNMLDAKLDACNEKMMNMVKGDNKGKRIIGETEINPSSSYSNSRHFFMPQHLYPPSMTTTDQKPLAAFWHEYFQLGQTSQPCLLHYGQNGMMSWDAGQNSSSSHHENEIMSPGSDHKFAMVKKEGVESNQKSYYNIGNIAQSLNYFGNPNTLPSTGFQVNGSYDTNTTTFQPPPMFNHMHGRK